MSSREFVSGYAAGSTPNPCIACNGEVRIAAMVDLAERLGATHLVTGHYARIVDDGDGPLLAAASDENKDQSYMLAALPPGLLERLRFPLTELTKPEVREIAARHDLAVARKPESQDLCFLSGQGKARLPAPPRRPARARGRSARPLRARRSAATAATTTSPSASGAASASRRQEPLYVLATDAVANTVTVGPRERLDGADRAASQRGPAPRRRQRRRRAAALPLAACPGRRLRDRTPAATPELEVELGEDFAGVSPGQTAVLLAGEAIVGHGTIAAAA